MFCRPISDGMEPRDNCLAICKAALSFPLVYFATRRNFLSGWLETSSLWAVLGSKTPHWAGKLQRASKFDTWNSDVWHHVKTCFARVRSRVQSMVVKSEQLLTVNLPFGRVPKACLSPSRMGARTMKMVHRKKRNHLGSSHQKSQLKMAKKKREKRD